MTNFKQVTIEHLGNEATAEDLEVFIGYCEQIQVFYPDWTEDQVTDAVFGDGNYTVNADRLIREAIVDRAKKTAKLFVDEWGEALDPEQTDWDGTAWGEDCNGLEPDQIDRLWYTYQTALVAETKRLVAEKHR